MATKEPPRESVSMGAEEKPTELERAKAVYKKRIMVEIRDLVGKRGDSKEAEYIAKILSDRLDAVSGKLTEDEKQEFIESMPAVFDLQFRDFKPDALLKSKGGPKIYGEVFQTKTGDQDVKSVVGELMRVRVLARAFNTDGEPHLHDHLAMYNEVLSTPGDYFKDPDKTSLTSERGSVSSSKESSLFENDPDLFADLTIMWALRSAGDNILEGFKQVADKRSHFDQYGSSIELSADGIPFRPGHRKDDIGRITERLKILENLGAEKVKTYDELTGELRRVRQDNEEKDGAIGGLQEHNKELERKIAAAEEATGTATAQLAAERSLRETSEEEAQTKIADLERRHAELLAKIEEAASGGKGLFQSGKALEKILELISKGTK